MFSSSFNFGVLSAVILISCGDAFAAAPVISGVQATEISTSSVTVVWTTDKASDSRVNYGLTSSYGKTARDSAKVTSHRLIVNGLTANSTYNFRVRSRDSAGSMGTSANFSFRTLALVPPPPPPPPPPPASGALTPGTKWYWQLQGTLNTSRAATVYNIDLVDTSTATIASLKQAGHFVVCYFSAGSYENWRPDASQFPAASLGNNMDGWAGEKWIDVRNAGLRTVMANRIALAKSKGCNAVEPDNVDGYSNRTGFPLSAQDQIAYNSFLADQAHANGLLVALKNSTDLVNELVNKFDFAIVEECFRYNECNAYVPFIQQNKAVLNAEYNSYSAAICNEAAKLKFSTAFFNLNLDGKVFNPCP